ncbi:MAG: BlaI/MecI/CopY family transcriptional regulator [Bacteroidales bacterium]|nr:BlaI/MecI/CopY family transcriptional regulator [Bacteroidales bacterium]
MKHRERTLTKVEFQIMSILWDIGHPACGHDILERYPEPKPTYTTIASYMRILFEKGFVEYTKREGEGKTQWYKATLSRQDYTRQTMQEVKRNFFDGSLKSMFSFFVKEEKLSADDILDLLETIKQE